MVSLPIVIAVSLVSLIAGYHAGFRMGQVDRTLRQFVQQCRQRRLRSDVLDLQRRAREET